MDEARTQWAAETFLEDIKALKHNGDGTVTLTTSHRGLTRLFGVSDAQPTGRLAEGYEPGPPIV